MRSATVIAISKRLELHWEASAGHQLIHEHCRIRAASKGQSMGGSGLIVRGETE